jgi:hypothetical protein
MRQQYDADDQPIDLATARRDYPACNLVVGNSTSFGVGASSDRGTFSSLLSRPGVPCLNFSIRGGTSQQELFLYLCLNRHLPPVDNIVLFSGVINITLAAIKATLFYPEFGAAFSEKEFFREFLNQYERFHHAHDMRVINFLKETVTKCYRKFGLVRWLANRLHGKRAESVGVARSYDFDEKKAIMMDVLRNDLRTWGMLQRGSRTKIHYVMQPLIGWTRKPLTPLERAMCDIDAAVETSVFTYANDREYRWLRGETAQACADNGIDFHDANEWLDDDRESNADLFTDVCHLNDRGNRRVAELLRERLAWNARSAAAAA